MPHAFSIDVEDWYQGIEIPMDQWNGYERRVEASMEDLLGLMARYDVTATCFVLGKVAEEHPELFIESTTQVMKLPRTATRTKKSTTCPRSAFVGSYGIPSI